jgi:hypothetical protein
VRKLALLQEQHGFSVGAPEFSQEKLTSDPSRRVFKCVVTCTKETHTFQASAIQPARYQAHDLAASLAIERIDRWRDNELWKERHQKGATRKGAR